MALIKIPMEKEKIWCGTSQGAQYYAISFQASSQHTQAIVPVTHKNMTHLSL